MICPEQRAAPRQQVSVGAVAANVADYETAVLIEDMSCVEFQMLTVLPLSSSDAIRIQLPQCGDRCAVVVRASGDNIGCKFEIPITDDELARVVAAQHSAESVRRYRAFTDWRTSSVVTST